MTMKTARLLLVENSPLLASLLPIQLAKHGYQVLGQARTGEEAVEKASALPLDIVLMDIDLDGEMDGIAAAEAIRKMQDVPVIFTTSHSDSEIQKRIQTGGPATCLLKPFTEKDLSIAIKFTLYRHKAEQERQRLENEVRRLSQLLESKAV
jgi:DNA-binding response OmpR family regulator